MRGRQGQARPVRFTHLNAFSGKMYFPLVRSSANLLFDVDRWSKLHLKNKHTMELLITTHQFL